MITEEDKKHPVWRMLDAMPVEVMYVLDDLRSSLRHEVFNYFIAQDVAPESIGKADVVLALLRINTPEALQAASGLVGKPITVCPAAIPPWPPRPVQRAPQERVVAKADENPCAPSSDMHRRFALVRVGMTVEALQKKGISRRDLRCWTRAGHIKIEVAA